MRAAGQIAFQTWSEIISWINDSPWPFETADKSQFEHAVIFNANYGGLHCKTKIKVRCSKKRLNSDEPCGEITEHTYSNIQAAINLNNDHLLCQGSCDSQKKGKASRKTLPELKKILKKSRGDTWKFDGSHPFIKATGSHWFHHPCGNSIYRSFYNIVTYPKKNKLPADTNQDCPFCTGHSAFDCVNEDVAAYTKWVNHISKGCVALVSKTMPSSADKLGLECQTCETQFIGSERGIKKYVRCGCPMCLDEKIHSPRAWDVNEARELVSRRGYVLLGEPSDYISITEMRNPEGIIIKNLSILDLLQQNPRTTIPADNIDPVNSFKYQGKSYSEKDELQLRKLLEEQSHSFKEIAYLMERTTGSIKTKTRRLGLRNDARKHINRIFDIKDNAFQIINKESAFFAGLIASDGCFDSRINRSSLAIELKAIDEDLLLNFMRFLGLKNNLKYRTMKTVEGRGVYAAIGFTSSECISDLKQNFNVDENKTHELYPPNFENDEVQWGFAAGLMAGDGYVSINMKKNEPILSFVSASIESANWMERLFEKVVGSVSRYEQIRDEAIYYYASVTGKKAVKIASILKKYDFGMNRKWKIIREMAVMKIK
jgi:hypothetical protein